MSAALGHRLFFSTLLALTLGFVVFSRDDSERGGDTQRYLPYISGLILPLWFLLMLLFSAAEGGWPMAAEMALRFCFPLFLHISLYYALLLPVLPWLRRHFRARSCAMLWLLPNYLYLWQHALPRPLFVLHCNEQLLRGLFALWALGVVLVLGYYILSHVLFRRRLLKAAWEVYEPGTRRILEEEVERAAFKKPKFRLMRSPAIETPLTIGLFARRVRLVLPEKDYSEEELRLIFRHELIHIGREDAWSKFFLCFCTAMCWFNPLMWRAMGRSAEDMELSCDETVLLEADETERRRYAELILSAAGDSRGFSTCLSATARALRYRLQSITKPKKRRSGALLIAALFFVLSGSCGYVALAYGEETLPLPEEAELYHVSNEDLMSRKLICTDEAALLDYLRSLPLQNITGSYDYHGEALRSLHIRVPRGTLVLRLQGNTLRWIPLWDENARSWYVEDLDWAYLEELLPVLPALFVEPEGDPLDVSARLREIRRLSDGAVVYADDSDESEPHGVFLSEARDFSLSFSHEPLDYEMTQENTADGTHYTVTAYYTDYTITFCFIVGMIK
ncbi:MAG: M56 family metallopeptidase [Ruminococcaceae bacterium]|nr:M56 family metallopeptidase [Oscillospiraceae bacterium]